MPSTLNGIGTKYYGEFDRAADGSYTTTEWVVVAWIPLYPLRSWRVLKESSQEGTFFYSSCQYEVMAVPLHIRQVARIYVGTGCVFAGIAVLELLVLILASLNEPLSQRVDDVSAIVFLVFLALATISFLAAIVLAASQRFHWMNHWLMFPGHVRRGLIRLYLVVSVPWVAWYGYHILEALNRYGPVWRRISDAFWHLLIVPIGVPLILLVIAFVVAGFRKSPLDTNEQPNRTPVRETKEPKTVWDALQQNPAFREQKELFEAMAHLCEDGVDADELPNGRGEFGFTPSNPIPCKTVYGSTAYLGRLRAPDGAKVVYNRIGSVASDVSPHPVDAYEISHPNGQKLATIFISPYQKRISGKAPRGFAMVR